MPAFARVDDTVYTEAQALTRMQALIAPALRFAREITDYGCGCSKGTPAHEVFEAVWAARQALAEAERAVGTCRVA